MTNLSQLCPVVWSLQDRHCPVSRSHCSAWPLQVQGRQLGNPQCPGRQRSHCRPYALGIHSHWPVASWQKEWTDPSGLQSHAKPIIDHNYACESNTWCSLCYWPVVLTPAALRPKKEGRWGAFVAVPANHVVTTLALATRSVTNRAERPLRVTLTGWEKQRRKKRNIGLIQDNWGIFSQSFQWPIFVFYKI